MTSPLTVDAAQDDDWGQPLPIKGIEIEAAVLFADIRSFSGRTASMNPIETLIFVNHFIAWITGESLRHRAGIIDKYIGDEVMVVFSEKFGSDDPVEDALTTAIDVCARDAWDYSPHMGIAFGPVVVGVTGTALAHDVSVFGRTTTVAARCASAASPNGVSFPAELWGDRDLPSLLGATLFYRGRDPRASAPPWEISLPDERKVKSDVLQLRELTRTSMWIPCGTSAEQRARDAYKYLWDHGQIRGGSPPSDSPEEPT